jgi:hypothetical protein
LSTATFSCARSSCARGASSITCRSRRLSGGVMQ